VSPAGRSAAARSMAMARWTDWLSFMGLW
jgi:hypothetical protein